MTTGTRVSRRILLADDEPELRHSLADALNHRGFSVMEASCGSEALELGSRERPDLSLLDINMPDMTGVDVFRRWVRSGLRFPVIMMTAEAVADLRVEAQRLGVVAVVAKPFGARELFDLVYRALGLQPSVSAREGRQSSGEPGMKNKGEFN